MCLEKNHLLVITSDHGNVEKIIDPYTGRPETKHDASLVPFYIVGKGFEHPKNDSDISYAENNAIGILADIAPTILALMQIEKPIEMTGQNLLSFLK